MAQPIWRDYFVNLGAPASGQPGVPFYIYSVQKTAVVFQGVSCPKPGATNAIVRINDICANYIANYFLEQPNPTMPAKPSFKVYTGVPGSGTEKETVQFYNDWSYDPQYDPSVDGQNAPIVLTFAPRQFLPVTTNYSGGSLGTASVYMKNGLVYAVTPRKYQSSDFNDDFNDDFLKRTQYFGDSYMILMSDYPGAEKVVYQGRTWRESKACPQFVLYYLNAYGGWDALAVEGKTVQTDAVTHYDTGLVYDNGRTTARGKMNHLNELTHNYEFWTGWLNAQQSARMHHLLNSPAVYVHDQETDLIYPLILTNPTTEYKAGNPGIFAYKIEAELAQDRMRR